MSALSLEPLSSPGVPPDSSRSEVERAWFSGGSNLSTRALAARTRALQLGATNYEAAARALLASKREAGRRLDRAALAVRLAPDLPFARMQLAAAYLDEAEYGSAALEIIAGLQAIPKNLEATLWLAASLLAMFAVVLSLGSLVFILGVGASVFRHAAHDVGDLVSSPMPDFARAALLISFLLLPLLLGEALMGLVLGFLLLGFVYCEPVYRRALTLSAILLVIGLYPITRVAGAALSALDSDPVAAAAHAVERSMSLPADVDVLARAEDDPLAVSALALQERRSGNAEAAKLGYERLLREKPSDPVVLATLANIHFDRGENERAIQLGERAAGLVRSPTLLFNLSQVYARSFRMNEFEGALAQAQAVDAGVVADLSQAGKPDFVADLAFPLAPIRNRMLEHASGDRFFEPFSRALMPGWLGESWKHTAAGLLAVALLGIGARGRWERSSVCDRCGRRICHRCDGSFSDKPICNGCQHLFHRPETTDPGMRTLRLAQLRAREVRLGRLAVVGSMLLPGVGGLLVKRADLSLLGLFFFAWASVLWLWRDGIVADPLAIGAAGPLVFAVAAGIAVLGYGTVVGVGLMIRRRL